MDALRILDIDLKAAQELKVLPGDKQYMLKITNIKESCAEDGSVKGLNIFFEAVQHPTSKDIMRYFALKDPNMTPKMIQQHQFELRQMLEAMRVPDMRSPNSWIGKSAFAVLSEVPDDKLFGHCNKIARWIGQSGPTMQSPPQPPSQ